MLESTHPLSARGADCYETPEPATRALLDVHRLPPGAVWDPACGPGAIDRVLRQAGYQTFASDIVDYRCPCQFHADFLAAVNTPAAHVSSIVMNPPYMHSDAFVRKALQLVPTVYALLRISWLEGQCRSDLIDSGVLAWVHPFVVRLPMSHRRGWTGNRTSSRMAFCWTVWSRWHRGPAHMQRLDWRAYR